MFDVFENRIIVRGKIIASKPLHIGASDNGIDPVQVDLPVLKDRDRRPLIPGSSLKGVLRSRLEAILRNPALKGSWSSCNVINDDESCIEKYIDDIKERNKDNYRAIAEEIYQKSCDVCKLFGNKQMSSRLQIKDMMYIGERLEYERRDGVGIDRDSGTAYPRAKYNFEIVPAGALFDFYMVAENLEEKQRKLLNLMLKLLRDGEISVGGYASRGLGQIKLIDEKIDEIDKNNIASYYGLG
ncbi:MAG TPA: CRISPR-associated RAMP protein [Clostridiaceae bacterium]|nr:CRISPR-associated RAMP protein [Clostridiaceae bacterium]